MHLRRTVVTYGTTCGEREVEDLLGVGDLSGGGPLAVGVLAPGMPACTDVWEPGGAAQPLASADLGVLIRGVGEEVNP